MHCVYEMLMYKKKNRCTNNEASFFSTRNYETILNSTDKQTEGQTSHVISDIYFMTAE